MKDAETVRNRLCNPYFNHVEMNEAIAAFDRIVSKALLAEHTEAYRQMLESALQTNAVLVKRLSGK